MPSPSKLPNRPDLKYLLESKQSMLNIERLPTDYNRVETVQDALAAAVPVQNVMLRLYIVWDNPADSLELERVLDMMRTTGAATVYRVEALK